jgi:hypothetical protein
MDVRRTYNGKWELRWREGDRRRSRTFDRKTDAADFAAWLRRRRQLGQAAVPDDVKLCELVETYWRLHAIPNLSPATRDLYGRLVTTHPPSTRRLRRAGAHPQAPHPLPR